MNPGLARALWTAARPKTLPAAMAPVVVGSACAAAIGAFRPGPAAACLLVAVLLQVGTNFANDVFDFEKGADNEERLGPLRVTQAGWLDPQQMRLAMWTVFGGAFLVGIYLSAVSSWWMLALGVLSILAGIAYTAGPFPLAYHGLGDVFVLIFFGFVAVCGTVYVQALSIPAVAWFAAAGVGSLSTGILAVNNVRDLDGDRSAGKKTLPVLLGRNAGIFEYCLLLLVAMLVPLLIVSFDLAPAWVLLSWVTLPSAVHTAYVVARFRDGPTLNTMLARTAKILLAYGLLIGAGIASGAP